MVGPTPSALVLASLLAVCSCVAVHKIKFLNIYGISEYGISTDAMEYFKSFKFCCKILVILLKAVNRIIS